MFYLPLCSSPMVVSTESRISLCMKIVTLTLHVHFYLVQNHHWGFVRSLSHEHVAPPSWRARNTNSRVCLDPVEEDATRVVVSSRQSGRRVSGIQCSTRHANVEVVQSWMATRQKSYHWKHSRHSGQICRNNKTILTVTTNSARWCTHDSALTVNTDQYTWL